MKQKKPTPKQLAQAAFLQSTIQTIADWGPTSQGYTLSVDEPRAWKGPVVIDIETDASEAHNFVGLALCELDGTDVVYYTSISDELRRFFSTARLIGHNLKSDMHWMQKYGMKLTGSQIYGDTMLMAYCANTTEESYGLKFLSQRELGWKYPSYRQLVGDGSSKATLDKLPVPLVAAYCGSDVAATHRLFKRYEATAYYNNIELPVYRTIFDMETEGAILDTVYLGRLRDELTKERDRLLGQIRGLTRSLHMDTGTRDPGGFNPSSPKQIQEIIFPALGIREESTDVATLKKYATIPVIQTILDFRSVSKLLGTYVEAFLALPSLPRVHAKFNQVAVESGGGDGTTGIRTGRLSSSDPNLQNIPARTDAGKRIREAFVASPGNELIVADYSQIELRVLAHYTGDQTLLRAFKEGRDVHAETGVAMFGDPKDDKDAENQRKIAKTINFGLLYGAGSKKLAYMTGKTEEEAEKLMALYWEKLPGVRQWITITKALAHHNGGVTTMMGRFIPLPGLKDSDRYKVFHAERAAVNYIIQGSAAEIMKVALLRLSNAGLRPILTVHDEFVWDLPLSQIAICEKRVVGIMQNAANLRVPLLVEASSGKNWREAK